MCRKSVTQANISTRIMQTREPASQQAHSFGACSILGLFNLEAFQIETFLIWKLFKSKVFQSKVFFIGCPSRFRVVLLAQNFLWLSTVEATSAYGANLNCNHHFPIDLAHQSEFRLMPNLPENVNFNPNLVWINKISMKEYLFLCVFLCVYV